MSNNQILCKYLDAGAKSSAVVLDTSLSTSNEQTIYLYHQQRNQIIEYKRDIVEPKLRELSDAEQQEAKQLQQAYQKALAGFTPRGAASQAIPERTVAQKTEPVSDSAEDEDADDDIGLIGDDDLLDDDDDED